MKKEINWISLFLEFVVVLIGILLAFQLNKCSAENAQLKTVNTHLIQIDEETRFNLGSIKYAIAEADINRLKFDTLFQLIYTKEDFTAINRLCIDLLNLGGLYLKKNAYTSLVQSGDIRFMTNFKEKQEVIGLYEYYDWVAGFEEMLADDFSNDFYPYVKTNFDMIDGKVQEENVYTSKKFLNILGAYNHLLIRKIIKYQECKKEMEEYLEERT